VELTKAMQLITADLEAHVRDVHEALEVEDPTEFGRELDLLIECMVDKRNIFAVLYRTEQLRDEILEEIQQRLEQFSVVAAGATAEKEEDTEE
jgi:hypothetical protein